MTIEDQKRSQDAITLDDDAITAHAHLFHALGDRSRLAVLQHLTQGPHRVRDLVAHLGLAQSTVSKHLSFLLECGLVEARPEGRASWHSLARPERLSELLFAAGLLLEATGRGNRLCLHTPQLDGVAGTALEADDGR